MNKVKIVIVGSGFAGLCMAIKLKQAGMDDFVILEKAAELGGTWRENTYPGAECDIPSALYSYSFEPNHKWEFKWSGQKQILKYQQDTAAKYQLDSHFHFNSELVSAHYQPDSQRWHLLTQNGKQFSAQHFVPAIGQLHHPMTPKFPGKGDFLGAQFHSAQWGHNVDLTGKQVVVIGNAASAVQFIPEIAEQVEKLTVLQRSPNWIIPKVDRAYAGWEQTLSAKVPLVAKVYRFLVWTLGEWVVLPALKGNPVMRWLMRKWSLRHLRKSISDESLREVLTPKYTMGAKRILFSDTYYPALERSNVELRCTTIERLSSSGLIIESGEQIDCDVIIYGTGFKTNPFLSPIDVVGEDGTNIRNAWSTGAQAYLGLATNGFPNMHMLYGPNTNLGHSSIIIMIEAQVNYVMQAILGLEKQGKQAMQVKADVENQYNRALQARLQKMAFDEIEASWYKDGNKITNNWAGGTFEYTRKLKTLNWSNYLVS